MRENKGENEPNYEHGVKYHFLTTPGVKVPKGELE